MLESEKNMQTILHVSDETGERGDVSSHGDIHSSGGY